MLDMQHQSRQGQAEAEGWASFVTPGGSLRSADALGSPGAGVAQPSGHGGSSSLGMLEGASMPYIPLAGRQWSWLYPSKQLFLGRSQRCLQAKPFPKITRAGVVCPGACLIQLPVLAGHLLALLTRGGKDYFWSGQESLVFRSRWLSSPGRWDALGKAVGRHSPL